MTMLSLRSLFTRGRALAHRGRFEKDLDEESLMLAVLGGAAGVLLASAGVGPLAEGVMEVDPVQALRYE
jgi:hypothetical protein